jgi:hypothetical protein
MIYEDYIRLHHIKEKIPDDRIGRVVQDYAARRQGDADRPVRR